MVDDAELLRRYVENRSEDAFAELVRRHLNLVYSVALRQVGGDAHLAEDVVQVVFTALARKASSLANRPVLGGWLYRTAQFAAIDVVRVEQRRRRREEAARAMHDVTTSAGEPPDWGKLRPSLDEAIGELDDEDRDAVVLRFFHDQRFAEIGARLQITENGARMRVDRAVEKLHALLVRRGVTSTTAALSVALGNQISIAAPAGLAASVSSTALAGSVGSGGVMTATGALLTMSKIKVGIAAGIVLSGMVTGFVELRANRVLKGELGSLRAASEDSRAVQKESAQLSSVLGKLAEKNPEVEELMQLRSRATVLKARPPGVVDAEFKPASAWRNLGRATPETANETFHWALFTGNLDEAAAFVVFSDDTGENRDAFMASFSEVVRTKYRTPERLVAAAAFGAGTESDGSFEAGRSDAAFQVIGKDDHVGGDGSRYGQVRLRLWYRTREGEREGGSRWQQTPAGWAQGAFALSSSARRSDDARSLVLERIDPATGKHRPMK